MSVLNVIKERRSIRRFKKEPISNEDAEMILDAARLAPSGGNQQRWKFVYVDDPRVLRMIRNCSPGLYGEPTSVIVIGISEESRAFNGTGYRDIIGILDAGFAAENILLAAHSLGLGGCAIASFNEICIKKILNAPEGWKPILLVSLGHPDVLPRIPPKKKLFEIVYLNEYGKMWDKLGEEG
jgi:nitroreductase